MFNINGKFKIFQCENCNLVFLNPQPKKKILSKHYPKNKYYSIKGNKLEDIKMMLHKLFYSDKFLFNKLIFYPLKPFLRGMEIVPQGKFLDIGCGDGKFLRIVRKLGMECYGVDPNTDEINEINLKIMPIELEKAEFNDNIFDVITLNHVIEHVDNPNKILKEIKRILKPRGTIIIGTPNFNSLCLNIFKKYWVQLDTPRHLFLFSKKILMKYAEKNDLEIVKIRYNSTPFQFLGSINYIMNRFRKKEIFLDEDNISTNKMLFILFIPISYILNFLCIGDQVEIYLKKSHMTNN